MIWDSFIWYAIFSIGCWALTCFFALYKKAMRPAQFFALLGFIVLCFFISNLWIYLERPPLRTMGETRLWYAFFLALLGILASYRYNYVWLLGVSSLLASVFLIVDCVKPELYSKTLMPALQSYWFIPHVTVYIFSYALLGVSFLACIKLLYLHHQGQEDKKLLYFVDNTVYIGFGFLMLGLLFGAFWAKEAWGHYWSWDPKETWAFITAVAYLIYIHLRLRKINIKLTLCVLPIAFILLLITWLGVSYLPTGDMSVHTYS